MKKFFDILPPAGDKEASSVQAPEPEPRPERPKPQKASLPTAPVSITEPDLVLPKLNSALPHLSLPAFPTKTLLVLVFFLVFLGGGIFLFSRFFPQAAIEIWPKTQSLDFTQEVALGKGENSLPGRVLSETQTLKEDFSATGQTAAEQKARGTVRIFNDYSATSQPLVANTRLISSDGKLFRLQERVVVPGQQRDSRGRLVPGAVEAQVQADEPGEEYNIGPTTFSIPGFVSTPKYTGFYAKSSAAMTGGSRGQVSVVSAEDLNRAKQSLEVKISDQINQSLRSKTPIGFLVVAEKDLSVSAESASKEAGQLAETFGYQVQASRRAVLLSQTDLGNLAERSSKARLDSGFVLVPHSLKTDLTLESLDSQNNSAKMSLRVSGKNYADLDLVGLKERVAGQSLLQVQAYLQSLEAVGRAQIRLSPFFSKDLPEDLNKIKITLNFE